MDHVCWVGLLASAYSRPTRLVRHFRMTLVGVLHQLRSCNGEQRLDFQERVLTMGDFLATWALEGAVHHLDLTGELLHADAPAPSALRIVRETLDRRLRGPVPMPWTDETYVLKGTGREPLTDAERRSLGELAERFPLLG